MDAVISLRNLVDEMQMVSDFISGYLNRTTGKISLLEHDDITNVIDDFDLDNSIGWQREYYQEVEKILSSDDYLKLPSKFDFHEYSIMQNYCFSIEDEALRGEFLDGISGKGAFRMFKNLIYRYGIENNWFEFRDEAFKKIAIDWLDEYDLPYKDDMENKSYDK